jgi:hypothetical protein
MKNKKPLQFVKELPPHAELWKIIDDTIIHPAEGLSVEQIKHYMYVCLCSTNNFKTFKHILQTNMRPVDLQSVKASVSLQRDLPYPELLPEVEELPQSLLVFLYTHNMSKTTLPDIIYTKLIRINRIVYDPIPDLSTLPHSDEVVEVYEKRQVELIVYRALIEKTPIPRFTFGITPTVVSDTTTVPSDDWVEWNGGDRPVAEGTYVEIRTRNGNINTGSYFRWGHSNLDGDIMAYRIIKEDRNET